MSGATIPEIFAAGKKLFMGVELAVAPGALIPREETELLGRTAVGLLRDMPPRPDGTLRAIDMCCGSGNLACGIASHVPTTRFLASDLTDGCVAVARTNVAKLGLGDRIEVVQGDLFAPLADRNLGGAIDMVVCNPPYISTGRLAKDRAELLDHEPREAFDGGPYGLSIHQRVIKDALQYLRPGGWLLFEIGLGQDKQVKILFERSKSYEDIGFAANEAGEPRVALGRRKAE